jgi:hypothetical protein
MAKIASLGGHDSYATANLQYGALGRMLMEVLGISGLANNVQIMSELSPELDDVGHEQWTLREPFAEAMEMLGLVSRGPIASDTDLAEALADSPELNSEPCEADRAQEPNYHGEVRGLSPAWNRRVAHELFGAREARQEGSYL